MAGETAKKEQLVLKEPFGSIRSGGFLFLPDLPVTVTEEEKEILMERYPNSLEVYTGPKKRNKRPVQRKSRRLSGNIFNSSKTDGNR